MFKHVANPPEASSRQHAAWRLLMSYGMPDGPLRPVPTEAIDEQRVCEALLTTLTSSRGLEPARRDALLAWLEAWRHHWPTSFERALGGVGEDAVDQLRRAGFDSGRLFKLRRIAVENLMGLL